MTSCDVLITGTGSLAETVLFAFSTADTKQALRVGIAGRNAERLHWLALAANGRAAAFGLPNHTTPAQLDWSTPGHLADTLGALQPRIIIQTASMQSPWTLGAPNAWARMIAAGGYGLATPLHTILTARLLRALEIAKLRCVVINGTFPDIANSILACMDFDSPVGFGNIDLVSVCIMASIGERTQGVVQALGQYEPHVAAFRLSPERRAGMSPRVWIKGEEVIDFQKRFASVRFPGVADDSLNQLTGTTVVPMALAFGLPGGYPVGVEGGRLRLRLPGGLSEAEAIAYNKQFEEHEGIVVDGPAKRVRLTGKAHASLQRHSPRLAEGYSIASLTALEAAGRDLMLLRERLESEVAA
jgi:hypothetical protein